MIETPFRFEAKLTDQEFEKLGRFLTRWSLIDHIIGNCLRRLLQMEPKPANVMVFPLTFDQRFQKIEKIAEIEPMHELSAALLSELRPLVKAMQYVRNTTVHGIVIDMEDGSDSLFHLRSKKRQIGKTDLFACEDLINYAAHVVTAFRLSLGDKDNWPVGRPYALPDRPPLPDFLPPECRSFPREDKVTSASQPKA